MGRSFGLDTMSQAITKGCHHLGLTVSDLQASAAFFTEVLGWQELGRNPDYPAVFVSDGTILVTLWALKAPDRARGFDKNANVGLHHVAFTVESEAVLAEIHARLEAASGVRIEFTPEPLRQGPAKHMMCYEPSGIRVEFIWPGT
jgi:catechol 2,3-dioxygenase-like lactoylglutathione lyase family enzyme